MSLKERINDETKQAMRARDSARLSALRLLSAAIKQREVDERCELGDEAILAVIEKQIKQRKESASQYEAGGRSELAAAERFELEVLSAFMPAALSAEEVDAAIERAITATGASGPAEMGKVMTQLKAELAGRADMSEVSARVRSRLNPR